MNIPPDKDKEIQYKYDTVTILLENISNFTIGQMVKTQDKEGFEFHAKIQIVGESGVERIFFVFRKELEPKPIVKGLRNVKPINLEDVRMRNRINSGCEVFYLNEPPKPDPLEFFNETLFYAEADRMGVKGIEDNIVTTTERDGVTMTIDMDKLEKAKGKGAHVELIIESDKTE